MLLTLLNALSVLAGSIHRSVSKYALWMPVFLTPLTKKQGSNCSRSGVNFTPVQPRPLLRVKLVRHFNEKTSPGNTFALGCSGRRGSLLLRLAYGAAKLRSELSRTLIMNSCQTCLNERSSVSGTWGCSLYDS